MVGSRLASLALAVVVVAVAPGCRDDVETSPPVVRPDSGSAVEDAGEDSGAAPRDAGHPLPDAGPAVDGGGSTGGDIVVGAWNLHHFSPYGTREFRIDAIAAQIADLDADVLGVEELQVEEGTTGDPPQAWDALLERLPAYEGVHNPWNTFDSTVGILTRTETTTLVAWETLFEGDSYAFPRPALDATVEVHKGGSTETFHVLVVHLKAFRDSFERRRAACARIVEHVASAPDKRYIVVGDYNDDPYDGPADNSFIGTFLDNEPAWYFVTASLPPESVTSTGFYHFLADGTRLTGEFLDHAVITGELYAGFASFEPRIVGRPAAEFAEWERGWSDHFPILVRFVR